MKTRFFHFLIAFTIGCSVTVVLAAAAAFSYSVGAELATRVLSWPNTLLQSLVPLHNIGTAEMPLYEGTPLNVLAYFASFPLGICVYTFAAYILIRRRGFMLGPGGTPAKRAGKC